MNAWEDIGYSQLPSDDPMTPTRSGPIPACCKWGYSEEGFVHQWLSHFDEASKDSALKLAEDGSEPWKRWTTEALRVEAFEGRP